MPNQPPIAQTDPIHLGMLSTSVFNQYEQALFWTNFSADVIRNKKGEMRSPYAPITRRRDLEGPAGQDNLTIPARKNLTGDPYYGQAIITGKGEKQKHDLIIFPGILLMQWRHSLKRLMVQSSTCFQHLHS